MALNRGYWARLAIAAALWVGASPASAQAVSGNSHGLLTVGALVAVVVIVIGFNVARLLRKRSKQPAVAPTPRQPAQSPASATAAFRPSAPMPDAYLEDVSGSSRRLRNRLNFPTVYIGRAPRGDGNASGDIVLERPSIGREHAVIEYRDGAFYMRDQGSRNGTYLNGSKLVGEVSLRNNDVIAFHNIEFRFEVHDTSAKEASAHAHMGTMMAESGEWQAYVQAGAAHPDESAAAQSKASGDAVDASDAVDRPAPAASKPASAEPDPEATVVLDADAIARNINKGADRRS